MSQQEPAAPASAPAAAETQPLRRSERGAATRRRWGGSDKDGREGSNAATGAAMTRHAVKRQRTPARHAGRGGEETSESVSSGITSSGNGL